LISDFGLITTVTPCYGTSPQQGVTVRPHRGL
jgi:hypothetical protein